MYNPSDHWKISIYLVFLDHLVEEISKRVVSNGERFLVSSLNLTLEIVDRLFNAYQTDLPRKVDFVGGIERCKSR